MEHEDAIPFPLAQAQAASLVEQYGKITGDSTKGFSISKDLITQLSTYVYPATTPIAWSGIQIYYGKNDDTFEFVCVPLDESGVEIQNSTLLFIPSITAGQLKYHDFSRPCPYACDRNSAVGPILGNEGPTPAPSSIDVPSSGTSQ